jgi:hypothetical protein
VRSTRRAPLLLHNTMRITEGHLEGFRHAVEKAVAFVEEHGPQLAVQVFIDEERLVAHSFQLYPDSAAIVRHWSLSDPYIREVMERTARSSASRCTASRRRTSSATRSARTWPGTCRGRSSRDSSVSYGRRETLDPHATRGSTVVP